VLLFVKSVLGKKAKFVVKLEAPVKMKIEGKRKKVFLNLLKTSGLVEIPDLKHPRYKVLKGQLN